MENDVINSKKEIWDIVDENGNLTGKTMYKGEKSLGQRNISSRCRCMDNKFKKRNFNSKEIS